MKKQLIFLINFILVFLMLHCSAYSKQKSTITDLCDNLNNSEVVYSNFNNSFSDLFTLLIKKNSSYDSTMFTLINPYEEAYAIYEVENPVNVKITAYSKYDTSFVNNTDNSIKLGFNNNPNFRLLCLPQNNMLLLNDFGKYKNVFYDPANMKNIFVDTEKVDDLLYWGVNVYYSNDGKNYNFIKNTVLESQINIASGAGYKMQVYSANLPSTAKYIRVSVADVFSLKLVNQTNIANTYYYNIRLANVEFECNSNNSSNLSSSSQVQNSSSSDIDLNISSGGKSTATDAKRSKSDKSSSSASKNDTKGSTEVTVFEGLFIKSESHKISKKSSSGSSAKTVGISNTADTDTENKTPETVKISQNEQTMRYLSAENNISTFSAAYATTSACYLTLSVSYLINKYLKANFIDIIKKLLNK